MACRSSTALATRLQVNCHQHFRSLASSALPAKGATQLLERRSLAGGGLTSGGRGGARQGRRAWWCRHEGLRPLLGRVARLAGVGGGASKWAGPVCRPDRAAGYESTRLGTADTFALERASLRLSRRTTASLAGKPQPCPACKPALWRLQRSAFRPRLPHAPPPASASPARPGRWPALPPA